MNLLDHLQLDTMLVPLAATDRQGAIGELVDTLAKAGAIEDAQNIKQLVWERELQRTTGIGEGLAIPHARCEKLNTLVMAMGRPTTPIDFSSPDKRPVELIILLVSPSDHTADHIQALGRISRLMVDRAFRETAYAADSSQALFDLFHNALSE
jgi:mannitol/fructose-specific phosphotransferase system IIA component (Ntr-type)